jgi:perosamine synthetase
MRTATALAIAGGRPAVPPGSHAHWPPLTSTDRAALARVLDRGILWGPNAPEARALEREWADYIGVRHCLLTNSGTAALHCAVVGAGVRPGDEVIVPAFSFVATPMAVLHAGAMPVFADIEEQTCTLDAGLVEELITERTRAVMPVHVHGLPADMDEIRAIAARHGLAVIEDAAQAHGALYRGVPVGALGDGATFSLNGSKHLPAGEGGLFVTNDDQAARTARRLAIFGEDTPPPLRPTQLRGYWAHGIGWNYRSHELTAALARAQLTRLDATVTAAQRNAEILSHGLNSLPGFVPPHVPEDRTCVYYRYRVRLVPEQLGFTGAPVEFRDRILHALRAEGVAASLWQLLPLPAQPVFRRPFGPWQPGSDGEPLAPWDRGEHPEAARLLESSIVLGTADEPLFAQPAGLMERYLEAFEKVVEGIGPVLTTDYRPVEPWPPREPPL